MGAYAEKICIALQEPSADEPGDSRTRLLDALGREHVRVTLSALQVLYPAIRDGRGRVTVTLSPADEGWELVRVEPGDTSQRLFALALDIGTTTLEMELLHLPDGAVLSRAGCFNGQCAVGDNILDRIFYAKDEPEHLRHLQELVLESIRGLIAQCCEQAAVRPEEIAALGAAGNTTMMHLLLGCEPWQIFQSPYTPVFLDPGVHSARYADGQGHDSQANMNKLLKEMEEKNDRKAQFRTIISLIEKGEERQFEGIVKGQITREKRGESGFGYDPIFQPDGYETTFAELGSDIKNRISHRARAVAALCDYLTKES